LGRDWREISRTPVGELIFDLLALGEATKEVPDLEDIEDPVVREWEREFREKAGLLDA
jgi:hypothetical protein